MSYIFGPKYICRSGFARGTHQKGFTLFEVSISLVLVAFGVVSVLMLLPSGLKAQQMARMRLLAATKAEEMIEQFTATQHSNPAIDSEGLAMWDQPVAHKAQSWDLECRLSSHRFGLMPLPPDIARRLDSDNDEIQQILANGGNVYYSQPLATTGTEEQGAAMSPPNEAQRMIIAVNGFAQQNALTSFPLKNWPYHTPMPSPPLHMFHMADKFLPIRNYSRNDYWTYYSWPWKDIEDQKRDDTNVRNWSECFCYPWETVPMQNDPDIQKVMDWPDETSGKHVGYFPYAGGRLWEHREDNNPGDIMGRYFYHPTHLTPTDRGEYPSRISACRYVAACFWYADKKGFTFTDLNTTDANPYLPFSRTNSAEHWKEVQAFRFLAHSTTCLTAWYSYSGGNPEDLSRGVTIPVVTLDSEPSPADVKVSHKLIKYFHERSLHLVNLYAASYPYDWMVPRPLQRVTMMDYPILQSDLFSLPLPYGLPTTSLYDFPGSSGSWDRIFGRSELDKPQQWRVVSPEPIRNIGVSATFPTNRINATMGNGSYQPDSHFGDISHYNISMPFDAAQRCRELVFWSVDWQSYEDFETAPGAPVDASKYPIGSPRCDWHASGHNVPTQITRSYNDRLIDLEFRDEQLWSYRNPEKVIMFWRNHTQTPEDPRELPTGADVEKYMVLNNAFENADNRTWARDYPDKGPHLESRKVFNGLFGADRNYNKKLDRGPVPKSVRLRAQQVARFNYYDPRVPTILR